MYEFTPDMADFKLKILDSYICETELRFCADIRESDPPTPETDRESQNSV